MPQMSHAYAVGRVRALERGLLSQAALQRLQNAQSPDEVARLLTELGWGECRTQRDVERQADVQVKRACDLVRECSPEPEITDCFLVKFDFLNLKVLLKARLLGIAAGNLSECGVLNVEKLRRAVEDNSYRELPEPFRSVMEGIERHIASEPDPLYIDAELDKAMFDLIHRRMAKCGYERVRRYFCARADLTNLLIALRVSAMGRDEEFARVLMVPGGEIDPGQMAQVVSQPEKAGHLVRSKGYFDRIRGLTGVDTLAALEKAADDYALDLIRPERYNPESLLPLIGYLLAKEREAGAVRLIVTAKAVGMSADKLQERLRELYEK